MVWLGKKKNYTIKSQNVIPKNVQITRDAGSAKVNNIIGNRSVFSKNWKNRSGLVAMDNRFSLKAESSYCGKIDFQSAVYETNFWRVKNRFTSVFVNLALSRTGCLQCIFRMEESTFLFVVMRFYFTKPFN